jgi:hypothetical protein
MQVNPGAHHPVLFRVITGSPVNFGSNEHIAHGRIECPQRASRENSCRSMEKSLPNRRLRQSLLGIDVKQNARMNPGRHNKWRQRLFTPRRLRPVRLSHRAHRARGS